MVELLEVYQKFEKSRVEKAEKATNQIGKIKPDPFSKFIVERTDLCPHQIITKNSDYWLETLVLVDGEQGLTLPGPMEDLPVVFYDALSIVRSARAKVRKEEEKK